jgi:hypothetical protein
MKKVVIISIIIVLTVVVFAVFAVKTDIFKAAETEKTAVEQNDAPKNIENNVKIPVRALKIQKIQTLDKAKLREAVKKIKEKREKNPDYQPNGGSCGK